MAQYRPRAAACRGGVAAAWNAATPPLSVTGALTCHCKEDNLFGSLLQRDARYRQPRWYYPGAARPGHPHPPLPTLFPLSLFFSFLSLLSLLIYSLLSHRRLLLFPGVSARRPEIQNFFCKKPSPSLPPLLPPCPSCWSRSRVVVVVASTLDIYIDIYTRPQEVRQPSSLPLPTS